MGERLWLAGLECRRLNPRIQMTTSFKGPRKMNKNQKWTHDIDTGNGFIVE